MPRKAENEPGQQGRQAGVFEDAEGRQQVEGLKNHADRLAAEVGEPLLGNSNQIMGRHDQIAGAGTVQSGQKGEQRAFARTAVSREDDHFTGTNRKVDPIDADHLSRPMPVNTGQFPSTNGMDFGYRFQIFTF